MKVEFNIISDTPNANGTVYPKDELKRAMDEYNEKYVKTGKALGEISQPKSELGVNVMNAAFKINKLEQIENEWLAEIEILETPKGEILKEILNEGMRIVTMGVGEIEKDEDGNNNIVRNFKIVGVGIEPKENCA